MNMIILLVFPALLICSFAQELHSSEFQVKPEPEKLVCNHCLPDKPNRCFFYYEECTPEKDQVCQTVTVFKGDEIQDTSYVCTDPESRKICDTVLKDPSSNMTTLAICCDFPYCNRLPVDITQQVVLAPRS